MSAGPTFEDYWGTFVRAHAAPSLRRLSFMAMSAGLGSATAFLLTRRTLFLLLAPVVAFVPPFIARRLSGESSAFAAEHPLYYAAASLKMWHMTLTGTMEGEVGRFTAEEPPRDAGDPSFPRPNMVTDHTLH
ncbi:MAG TPA: Mpo1-like protein [Polyangiaceae bacterium]|jgi:hypothetical protein|nr:Mpo1-like protein [Polyangiaceae bacterium]